MVEITEGELLEIEHAISFRDKIRQIDLNDIEKDIEEKIRKSEANKIGNPITATYSIEGNFIDVELIIPIDKKIDNIGKYKYKERLKLVNAIVAKHKGNPMMIKNTYNELNQYIEKNNLIPITVGYNVTKNIDYLNTENSEIDIYVGISPNIL